MPSQASRTVVATTILCLLLAASVACTAAPPPRTPTPARATAASRCEASHPDLCDFFEFAGFRYGDTRADVESLLGRPERIDPHDGSDKEPSYDWITLKYYRDEQDRIAGDLSINVNKATGTVTKLRINSTTGMRMLRDAGADDPKLFLYGTHRDHILDLFGMPEEYTLEYHIEHWFHDDLGRRGLVEFTCYDFDHHLCEDLAVTWFH